MGPCVNWVDMHQSTEEVMIEKLTLEIEQAQP
jgi:hypothetical protein